MHVLYLPGFSLKNKSELDAFATFFSKQNITITTHEWRHWSNNEAWWSPETEIDLIKNKMESRETYTLVCKSIGTYMGARLAKEIAFEKIVFMGIPLNDLDDTQRLVYDQDFAGDPEITVFQREHDSHGNFLQVSQLIKSDTWNLNALEGESHEYTIPELVWGALL